MAAIKILMMILIATILHWSITEANVWNEEKLKNENQLVKSSQDIASFFTKTRGVLSEPRLSDLVLRLAVHFDLDSDQLTGPSKAQLDNLAKVLLDPLYSNLKIELAGHTCDIGSAEYNLALSGRRVKSAYLYLVKNHHIDSSRISTRAYGEAMPLIPGAITEKDRAINRRVVTYLPGNRETVEKMLKEMPFKMGFRWAMLHYKKDNTSHLVKYDGSSQLKSGDAYRIFLRPSRTKYVYIYQIDAHGKGEWLFPREEMGISNPLQPDEYFLPSRSEVYVLDENVGKETIYFVVTEEPAADLEALIKNKSNLTFSEAVTQTVKTRGLKKIRIGPPAQSPDVKSQTIIISPGAYEQKIAEEGLLMQDPRGDVVNIMAQYPEFFIRLEFEHK